MQRPTWANFQPQVCQSNFTPLRLTLESEPSGIVSGPPFYQLYDSRLLQFGKPSASGRAKANSSPRPSCVTQFTDADALQSTRKSRSNQILIRSRIEATPSKARDMWACVL